MPNTVHAVQAMEKTTAEENSSFLLRPPARGKFDALKVHLISILGLTQTDKDTSLLGISGLDDCTIRFPLVHELSDYG